MINFLKYVRILVLLQFRQKRVTALEVTIDQSAYERTIPRNDFQFSFLVFIENRLFAEKAFLFYA